MSFTPRKLLFKAWNQETRLLMRLNRIDCVKGELLREGHILLQFTGWYDQQHEEIYEMDMLLIESEKFVVMWDKEYNQWILSLLSDKPVARPFSGAMAAKAIRICSYFESERSGSIT